MKKILFSLIMFVFVFALMYMEPSVARASNTGVRNTRPDRPNFATRISSVNIAFSDDIKVYIETDGVAQFNVYVRRDPPTIFVDVMGVSNIIGNKTISIHSENVKNVRLRELSSGDGTRIAIDFDNYVASYNIYTKGNYLIISIGNSPLTTTKNAEKAGNYRASNETENPAGDAKRYEGTFYVKDDDTPGEGSYEVAEGLKAEMEGRWEDAIENYKSALKREPHRVDLWIRIADIEAKLGRSGAAADALRQATVASPNDPVLYYTLSQAYSVADKKALALEAIERATEIDPDNIEYLRARAVLANWNGIFEIAKDSYERILAQRPADAPSLLGMARIMTWAGKTDKATGYYKKYVEANPADSQARLDYARSEFWRGNSPRALKILEGYREDFGESDDYFKDLARVLASAHRPTAALEITEEQLEKYPDEYELHVTKSLALAAARRPREAKDSLEILKQMQPDSPRTADITRFVMTPMRSSITPSAWAYFDSDEMIIIHEAIEGEFFFGPETRLLAGVEADQLHAERGSGLEGLDGKEDTQHYHAWVGLSFLLDPRVNVEGRIGSASAEDDDITTYLLDLNFQPRDDLGVSVISSFGFYLISTRSIDIGVKRASNLIQLRWNPVVGYHADAGFRYDHFSDKNRRWELTLSPRKEVLRRQRFNLDIGASAMLFGFSDDLDNGYYDPEFYQRYLGTLFGYYKINDDNGISMSGGLGVQKDDRQGNFGFSGNGAAEAFFGIYDDWLFVLGGSIFNTRLQTGAFHAYSVQGSLKRRF
ncbi:MAG: tetratricopeptide repeat protein [Candidatus Dadabacteria bacterium]|nr:tetratricopeptide repeat protein [Candidatus Dadabacteria bacterium]